MTTTTTTQAPATTWQVDKLHSSVDFSVKHMVVSSFRGAFDEYDATLTIDESGTPQVRGTAYVSSVNVSDENLNGHLQSPDFFDAERFPEITVETVGVQRIGNEVTFDVDLTLRGHTERVQATGELNYIEADMSGAARYGVDLTTTVDRTKYGLHWNAALPKGGYALGNDVKLTAHLEFVPGE